MSENVTDYLLISTTPFTSSSAGYEEHTSAPDHPLMATATLITLTTSDKEHTSILSTQDYPSTSTISHITSTASYQESTSLASVPGIIKSQLMATPSEVPVSSLVPTPAVGKGTSRMTHGFSEPVVIVIVLGVIAGIVGTILLISFGIRKLTRKSSLDIQLPTLDNTGGPLSSMEAGYPAQ